MLDSILSTVNTTTAISPDSFFLCTAASLVLGILGALVYMFRNTYTKGFVVTLALLPPIIQLVIMLVNGNLGAGVAVMGAFSLIRFRSAPGTAREIVSIFLAMAIGLATGMGYVFIAAVFFVIIAAASIVLTVTGFGENKRPMKSLRVTIPESLDYNGIFDDLFQKYTLKHEFMRVKSTNLGSLFELHYHVLMKDETQEKRFIDDIRCRNGNLNITLGRIGGKDEL